MASGTDHQMLNQYKHCVNECFSSLFLCRYYLFFWMYLLKLLLLICVMPDSIDDHASLSCVVLVMLPLNFPLGGITVYFIH